MKKTTIFNIITVVTVILSVFAYRKQYTNINNGEVLASIIPTDFPIGILFASSENNDEVYLFRPPGSTFYVQFIDYNKQQIWSTITGSMLASPDWTDTDIAMNWNNYLGCYVADIPHNLPTGQCLWIVIRQQADSIAKVSDSVEVSKICKWGTLDLKTPNSYFIDN